MLRAEIIQSRIEHGYSQSELARVAGVPRERLRQLESGGNITLATFEKIVAALPNLKTVSLGPLTLQTPSASLTELRDTLAAWLETGRRLLTMLESASAAASPELELRVRRLEESYARKPDEKT